MITATYGIAGLMLAGVCYPFAHRSIGLKGLGICSAVIFFVASSADSAAYLTVSEIFPLEMRAFAIAIFYAIGTLTGGVGAPLLFGELISTGSKIHVAEGWALGAALMLLAAALEGFIGVEAAGKSLESVSSPFRAADGEVHFNTDERMRDRIYQRGSMKSHHSSRVGHSFLWRGLAAAVFDLLGS